MPIFLYRDNSYIVITNAFNYTDTPSPQSKPSYEFSGRKSSWSISHRCHTWTSSQSHGWACAGQGTIVSSSQTVFHKPELRAMSMCGEKFFWQLFWWCFVIGHLTSEERFVVFHLLVSLVIWLMLFPAIFRLEHSITTTEKNDVFDNVQMWNKLKQNLHL